MQKKVLSSLGNSDFKNIREGNQYYVDKSLFIRDVIDGNGVCLFTRPRRFGKTLSMSTLRYFYGNDADYAPLFDGLAIANDENAMAKQGKNPVIFLSLKEVKARTAKSAYIGVCTALLRVFESHEYLEKSPLFGKKYTAKLRDLNADKPNLDRCKDALLLLSNWLADYHQSKVVILIDEYDTPITTGWTEGYYREIVDFLKPILSSALKDNPNLEKGVLTGVLRVSKESFFSDFNNFTAYSVIGKNNFSDKFGFTPEEVKKILRDYDMNGREWESITQWYDGYRFGDSTIFNPWSILNFVDNPAESPKPYWVNTSSNELLKDLLFYSTERVKDSIEALLNGEKINVAVNEYFTYGNLRDADDAVWNLMLFGGYLSCENERKEGLMTFYDVFVPNLEVAYVFQTIIKAWLAEDVKAWTNLDYMLDYLVQGKIEQFENYLEQFTLKVASYHDVNGNNTENFYHAFFLGLFVRLDGRYIIRSNRESGKGRYDIALIPRNPAQKGFVIETKAPNLKKRETLKWALAEAEKQVLENLYETELTQAGVGEVLRLAIAVQGKEVLVKEIVLG
jgi:Predicted AAA-ATPase/PD-(D/E)XK nuclease superfamily